MRRSVGSSLIVALLTLVTLISGCEKKRKTQFVQGNGEHVWDLGEFKDETYTLKTGKRLTRGVTTKADVVVVEADSVIRSYDAVEFEMETPFGVYKNDTMSNFQFFGKENTEYTVKIAFTEDNLVFFKVAPEELIPSDEMTYAQKADGNNYRVPIFGLPLTKLTVERVKDERGKASNKVSTYTKQFLSEATHFNVKATNPKYFASKLKVDMFPAKFFDSSNEWFFEVTVVDRPLDNNDTYELGRQIESGKAKFYKTNKTLTVVSQNVAEELKDQDPEKQTTLLEIPAKWMDFRLMTTGDEAYLKEEVFDDIAAGAKYWSDREYVQLGFDKILSDVLGSEAIVANALRIKRLEVADDYFSFIVFDALSKISLHFSFAKENRAVAGLNYPLEDWKNFGFFRTNKKYLTDSLTASEEAQIKNVFIQRMYPKDNVITFHITENTPQDPVFIEAIQASVDAWDQAFAEAAIGTPYEKNPIRVVLDNKKPVQNGDARYHKVSFYGYEVASGLLGYGPSVADDRNGETYSSTNHIYLRNYREQILRNLIKYVRYRIGVYHNLDVQGLDLPNQVLLTTEEIDYDFNTYFGGGSAAGATFSSPISMEAFPSFGAPAPTVADSAAPADLNEIPDYAKIAATARDTLMSQTQKAIDGSTNNEDGFKDFLRARTRLASGQIDEKQFGQELKASVARNTRAGTCDHLAGSAISFKEIEDVCMGEGDEFRAYVEELLESNYTNGLDYRLDNEKSVMYACAQKLMRPTLISTLVHEFGHNFGLTHNFAGSADAANFKRDANGIPEVRSTSVMDYAHTDAHRGFKPGTYDIATIRYGYYQSVEVKDKTTGASSMVDISRPAGNIDSISDRLRTQISSNQVFRKFQYCWDYDIATGEVPLENPNCRRRDQGSDPVSQVLSFIDGFNNFMMTTAVRFDNYGAQSSATAATNTVGSFINPIKLLYDKYRYTLFDRAYALGINDPYFDIFTADRVEESVIGRANLDAVKALKAEIKATSGANAATLSNLDRIALENKILALPEIAQYKLASEFIKDFFSQLVFSSDMYCVAVQANGSAYSLADIQPFATLRTTIYNTDGADVVRCEDAGVLSYFQGQAAAGSLNGVSSVEKVVTVGNPTQDIVYSADIQVKPIRNLIRAGYAGVRNAAISMFANRSTTTAGVALIQSNSFFPSILDENSYRTQILEQIRTRYVNGEDGDKLVADASKRLGAPVALGPFTDLKDPATGRLFLPFYETEAPVVQAMLASYRTGAISPKSATTERISNILISTSPETTFLSFIRTATDAAEYRYFTAGSTVYYSKGAIARDIVANLSTTMSSTSLSEQLLQSTGGTGTLTANSANQVKRRLVEFTKDFAAEYAGDLTTNNILYKIRVCVKDQLIAKYGSLISGYSFDTDPDAPYITSVCRSPSNDVNAGTIAEYFTKADNFLAVTASSNPQSIAMSLVNNVLTSVGLPARDDAKRSPQAIIEATATKSISGLTAATAFERDLFLTLAQQLIQTEDGQKQLASLATNSAALDAEIGKSVQSYTTKLKVYSKYSDLFKKKVDILQTAIYNSAR